MERHNKPEVEYGRNPELLLEPARSAAAPLPCCAVELDPPCADAIAMLARAGGAVPQRERALHDRGEHQQRENKHQGVTLRICAVRSQLRSAQTHPTAVQVKQSDELEEILAKKFLVSNLRHPRSSALAAALRRRRAWGRLRRSLPFPPRRDSWRRGRMRSKCFAESPSRRAAASPGRPRQAGRPGPPLASSRVICSAGPPLWGPAPLHPFRTSGIRHQLPHHARALRGPVQAQAGGLHHHLHGGRAPPPPAPRRRAVPRAVRARAAPQEIDREISDLKLSVNTRGRVVATDFLKGFVG